MTQTQADAMIAALQRKVAALEKMVARLRGEVIVKGIPALQAPGGITSADSVSQGTNHKFITPDLLTWLEGAAGVNNDDPDNSNNSNNT